VTTNNGRMPDKVTRKLTIATWPGSLLMSQLISTSHALFMIVWFE